MYACLTACSYLGFVGIYRMMKNNKDGLYWLFVSNLSTEIVMWLNGTLLFIPIVLLILLIPFMFICKNKLSAWKVLQNNPIKLVDDPIYSIMIFFLVIGILGIMALLFI
jgi:hypothetical protein